MAKLKKLIAYEDYHQVLLGVLFLVYIVSGMQTSDSIARMVDSTMGYIILAVLGLSMFAVSNPIVGLLGLVSIYELIRRSQAAGGYKSGVPSESTRLCEMEKYNHKEKTLEEEVVQNMVPMKQDAPMHLASYSPILNNTQDAAPVDYDGVN